MEHEAPTTDRLFDSVVVNGGLDSRTIDPPDPNPEGVGTSVSIGVLLDPVVKASIQGPTVDLDFDDFHATVMSLNPEEQTFSALVIVQNDASEWVSVGQVTTKIVDTTELEHWPQGDARGMEGFTLLEVMITVVVISIMLISILPAIRGSQDAFVQSQIFSQLNLRAQNALDRIVDLSGQGVTTDAEFSPLKPNTGINSHCLRFRLLTTIDTVTGEPVYDDNARVYLYGPDDGTDPCAGIIVGRGPNLGAIYNAAAGSDSLLGTLDDDTTVSVAAGLPAVELLLPKTFAPETGEMFTVNVNPAPIGRLLTFTLRLNAIDKNGNFLLPNDLVLSQTVALRQ